MSTEGSTPARSSEVSEGPEIRKKQFEGLESGLGLQQIVSLHLGRDNGRIFEAGGEYETIMDKEVVKRFDKLYRIVDPTKNLGGRNHNIEWSKDSHPEAIERLEGDDLYVTGDVPGVLDSIREYRDDRRVNRGILAGYQKDMEDAMRNWTNQLADTQAEVAIAVRLDEDMTAYVSDEEISPRAYDDLVQNLDVPEHGVYAKGDWNIIRMNYSK